MSTSRYPALDLRSAYGGGEVLAGIDLTAGAGPAGAGRRTAAAFLDAHPQRWDMAPARACRRGR